MLDPRTKLLLALAYGTLIALTRRPEWLLAEWALLVAAIVVMNRWKAYLRWLAMLVPMALFFGGVTWWSTDRATGQAAATSLLAITTPLGFECAGGDRRPAFRCASGCRTLDLRNSGDTAGPRDQVVGYGAYAFMEKSAA